MGSRIEDVVAELTDRVTRLEQAQSPSPELTQPPAASPQRGDLEGSGSVTYRGSGPWDGSTVAWDMTRSWDDVVTAPLDGPARVMSALANPSRLRLVAELVGGPATTAALGEALDVSTTGQLFHHLKELLAAGVVHQPRRGVYALRPQHVVALLTIMCAASDLTAATDTTPA